MTTKIEVNGLRMQGYHGVFAQETRVGNLFSYDVEVIVPWLDAAGSDDISLTVSYADIVDVVREVNAERRGCSSIWLCVCVRRCSAASARLREDVSELRNSHLRWRAPRWTLRRW